MTERPSPIPLRPDPSAIDARARRSLARALLANARSVFRSDPDPLRVAEAWAHDDAVQLILRAAKTPTTIADAPGLATVATAFLASLVPVSAAADLFARALQLEWKNAATISLPTIAPPVAGFVGEAQPIPFATTPTSAGATLTPFKLAVMVGLTNEVINGGNAETLVRTALAESVGPALDAALFSADPGDPELRPPGLLNGIAALTPSIATDKAEALVADLAALAGAIAPVAGNGGIAVIAAPAQAVAIGLRLTRSPYAVLVSSALEPGTVIAVALNGLVSVPSAPRIDAARETVAHMEDTPLPIGSEGAPATIAAPVASTYQTDSVMLRMIMPVAWTLRDPRAVAWMENVAW